MHSLSGHITINRRCVVATCADEGLKLTKPKGGYSLDRRVLLHKRKKHENVLTVAKDIAANGLDRNGSDLWHLLMPPLMLLQALARPLPLMIFSDGGGGGGAGDAGVACTDGDDAAYNADNDDLPLRRRSLL